MDDKLTIANFKPQLEKLFYFLESLGNTYPSEFGDAKILTTQLEQKSGHTLKLHCRTIALKIIKEPNWEIVNFGNLTLSESKLGTPGTEIKISREKITSNWLSFFSGEPTRELKKSDSQEFLKILNFFITAFENHKATVSIKEMLKL